MSALRRPGSEAPQSPAKRQRGLSKACELCRAKKSRCDSERPCGACRQKGVECVYREKGQPGLRPGYGKAMETRMSALEESMASLSQSMQAVLERLQPEAEMSRGGAGATEMPAAAAAPPPPPPPPTDDRNLALPADDWLPATPITASSQAVDGRPPPTDPGSSPDHPPSQPPGLSHDHGPHPPDVDLEVGLPPRAVLVELTDLFFTMVYPWAPLFYERRFRAELFAPERAILRHALVVVAFRFWTRATPTAAERAAYVQGSRQRVLLAALDACSLVSTQALALLAVDAVGEGPGPRTWNIMAMLVAAARQLCLAATRGRGGVAGEGEEANTPVVSDEPEETVGGGHTPGGGIAVDQPTVEGEEKRRLFWVVYSLDRFASIFHGQPGAIDTKSIRLLYPADDGQWGQPAAAHEWFPAEMETPVLAHRRCSLWHHYVDVLTLVDRSHRLLIQPVNVSLPASCQAWQSRVRQLDAALATWHAQLPPEVRCRRSSSVMGGGGSSSCSSSSAPLNPVWTLIHASYLLCQVRMYMIAAFPSTTSPYLRPSAAARGRLRQTGRELGALVADLPPHELTRLGPILVFILWVSARTLTTLWARSGGGGGATTATDPPHLAPLLDALRLMAPHWPCAQQYVDIIEVMVDSHRRPGGGPPAGLDIFGDPRRTTYVIQSRYQALTGRRRKTESATVGGTNAGATAATATTAAAVAAGAGAGATAAAMTAPSLPASAFPFSPSLNFFDLPLLDVGDMAGPLIGTATFGTEIDGEWL